MKAGAASSQFDHMPAALNLRALARRACVATIVEVHIGMIAPRSQALINPLQEPNIVGVIAPHDLPALWIARHAAKPKVFARIRKFCTNAEITSEIIKTIRIIFKITSSQFEGINSLVGGWRLESVDEESGIGFSDIETVPVMRD